MIDRAWMQLAASYDPAGVLYRLTFACHCWNAERYFPRHHPSNHFLTAAREVVSELAALEAAVGSMKYLGATTVFLVSAPVDSDSMGTHGPEVSKRSAKVVARRFDHRPLCYPIAN